MMNINTAPASAADVETVLRGLPLPWPGKVDRPDLIAAAFPGREFPSKGAAWLLSCDELEELRRRTWPSSAEYAALVIVSKRLLTEIEEGARWRTAGIESRAALISAAAFAEILRSLLSSPRCWDFLPTDSARVAIDALANAAEKPTSEHATRQLNEAIGVIENALLQIGQSPPDVWVVRMEDEIVVVPQPATGLPPPPPEWSFQAAGYTYRGKTFAITGKSLAVLRCLVAAAERGAKLTIGEIIKIAWPDYPPDEGRVRSTISALRKMLVTDHRLGKDANPIQQSGRGNGVAVWWLDMNGKKQTTSGAHRAPIARRKTQHARKPVKTRAKRARKNAR